MSVSDSARLEESQSSTFRPQQRWSMPLRIGAAAALVLGPALQVAEELLEPASADDAERFTWISANLDAFTLTKIVGFLAVPALIGMLVVFAVLARGRAPRLSMIGAAVGVLAVTAVAAIQGTEYAVFGGVAASGGDVAQVEALFTALDESGFATMVFLCMLIGMFLGLVLLMVALWMSKAVPRWAPALIVVFLVVDFLGLVPMSHAILLVGTVGVAYGVISARSTVTGH
ncbi:hypothetical protein [Planotetraspora kaengkrachanensis]|uniref:DUF4386 family protein n=1 Tax=Planotetraspora kaengkrachanensis TaxID=575193 RepID=A0A8J3LTD3_9ACTN|nr:hypothetical protein [Planotetraspora kaengkrachanensis]GIG78387.1 hypothetical protein Pka01_15140 [Planotetraspora kaengkrachanensis]